MSQIEASPTNRLVSKTNNENDEQATLLALEKFVRDALEATARGAPSRHYQTLLTQLSSPGAPRWYAALAKCASLFKSQFDGPFSELLKLIFDFDYRTTTPEATESHVNLLLQLALANSGFILPCFRVFCQSFKQEECDTRAQVHNSIHSALRQLLQLSPIATAALFTVFLEMYPHQHLHTTVQEVFVKNLLRVSEYADSLRPRILSLIVERLVILDVEVGGEEDDKYAEDTAGELRDKLDILMCMLFDYLNLIRKDRNLSDSTWESLSSIFEKSILKTQRARFLPFLIFFHASLSPKYADKLMRRLLQKAVDPETPDPERINSAAYLASFIARAGYVQALHLQFIFTNLLRWLHAESVKVGGDDVKVGLASTSQHLVYYGLCQAMMYIFNKRISDDSAFLEDDSVSAQDKFRIILTCSLNPLRYCSATIVTEFVKRVKRLQIFDASGLLRENSSLTDGSETRTAADLLSDVFCFAFEPYTLPKSSKYVNGEGMYLQHKPELPEHPHSRSTSPVSLTRNRSSPLRTPFYGSISPSVFPKGSPVFPKGSPLGGFPALPPVLGHVSDDDLDVEMTLSDRSFVPNPVNTHRTALGFLKQGPVAQ